MPLLRFGCAAALTLALTGPASTVPFAAAAPRVDYTLRVCASDTTPTNATITYGVGVGESVAEQGRTSRWLGAGCWERTVAAYTYDGAAVAAFLGLLWPRLKGRDAFAMAAAAALATVVAVPFVPPGVPIIVAAAVSAAVWAVQHRRRP